MQNLRDAPTKRPLRVQHRVSLDELDELEGLRGLKDPPLDDLPVHRVARWIAPPRPPPWRNPRKGRDQILPSGNPGLTDLKPHVRGEPEDDGVVDDVERPVEGAEGQPRRPLQPRRGRLEDAQAGQRPRRAGLRWVGWL